MKYSQHPWKQLLEPHKAMIGLIGLQLGQKTKRAHIVLDK